MSTAASAPKAGVIARAARRLHAVRRRVWHHVCGRLPEGCVLPRWALAARWFLFPIDSAYWTLGRARGYDIHTDTWQIEGMRFTGRALQAMANADGETYLVRRTGQVVTMERPAAQQQPTAWRPMETAPRDGTLLRLLVDFDDHPTDDSAGHAPTIGANNFDNTGEDAWQLAGWCWTHDYFTEGKGTPVGWLPLLPDAFPPAEQAARGGVDWRARYEDRRSVISAWHAKAVGLGYDGIADMLSCVEQGEPPIHVADVLSRAATGERHG